MTTRKKQVRDDLTIYERDAIAAFAAYVGRPWRDQLIKFFRDDIQSSNATLRSAVDKLGVSGIKKFRRSRSSMTWATTQSRARAARTRSIRG